MGAPTSSSPKPEETAKPTPAANGGKISGGSYGGSYTSGNSSGSAMNAPVGLGASKAPTAEAPVARSAEMTGPPAMPATAAAQAAPTNVSEALVKQNQPLMDQKVEENKLDQQAKRQAIARTFRNQKARGGRRGRVDGGTYAGAYRGPGNTSGDAMNAPVGGPAVDLARRTDPDGIGGRLKTLPPRETQQSSAVNPAVTAAIAARDRAAGTPQAQADRISVKTNGTIPVDPRYAGPGQLTTENVIARTAPGQKQMPGAGQKFVQGQGIVADPTAGRVAGTPPTAAPVVPKFNPVAAAGAMAPGSPAMPSSATPIAATPKPVQLSGGTPAIPAAPTPVETAGSVAGQVARAGANVAAQGAVTARKGVLTAASLAGNKVASDVRAGINIATAPTRAAMAVAVPAARAVTSAAGAAVQTAGSFAGGFKKGFASATPNKSGVNPSATAAVRNVFRPGGATRSLTTAPRTRNENAVVRQNVNPLFLAKK